MLGRDHVDANLSRLITLKAFWIVYLHSNEVLRVSPGHDSHPPLIPHVSQPFPQSTNEHHCLRWHFIVSGLLEYWGLVWNQSGTQDVSCIDSDSVVFVIKYSPLMHSVQVLDSLYVSTEFYSEFNVQVSHP